MTTHTFPLETAVARALEAAAMSHGTAAQTARERGDTALAKNEQRAANAAARGLAHWQEGVRPEMTEAGNWLLPSQRPGEPPHLLWQDRERCWQCSCPAGASAHWAMAVVEAVERAYDDDGLLPLPFDGEAALPALDYGQDDDDLLADIADYYETIGAMGDHPPITARLSASLDAAERALWPGGGGEPQDFAAPQAIAAMDELYA